MACDDTSLLSELAELAKHEAWDTIIRIARENEARVSSSYDLSWQVGWAYFKRKRFAPALRHLGRAVELEPENAIGLWSLGVVQREQGAFAEPPDAADQIATAS